MNKSDLHQQTYLVYKKKNQIDIIGIDKERIKNYDALINQLRKKVPTVQNGLWDPERILSFERKK